MRQITVIIIFVFLFCASAESAFIEQNWGTRGAGKGGAFIASADDSSSMVWNPAGLAQIYMRECSFYYNKPYLGLDGVDIHMGNFSFVYPLYGIINTGISASIYSGNSIYKEHIYKLSAARDFFFIIPNMYPVKVSAGINLKYLYHSFIWDDEIKALDDPLTDKKGAGAFTMDIGFLFNPLYRMPVGITVNNLIKADVGLIEEDIVPSVVSLGTAYRFEDMGKFEEIIPEVKLSLRDQEYGQKLDYALGVETWFSMRKVGLRTGFNRNEICFGLTYERFIENIGFRIDYAALVSTIIGSNLGSHRISTSIKF
ncbi:hypothetical protein ACFLTD_02415 [Elusimicrobiota bacterium]